MENLTNSKHTFMNREQGRGMERGDDNEEEHRVCTTEKLTGKN